MRRWLAGSAAVVGLMLTVPGCGGSDDTSDELVRIHAQDKLDFRMDASDGPGEVIQLDETWVVMSDGSATETLELPAPGHSKTTKLSSAELSRIKDELADLDLSALEDRFGTDKAGRRTTVVTYGGRTVTLDSRVNRFAPVDEAPAVARPFSRLVKSLVTLWGAHRHIFEPTPSIHQILHDVDQQMKQASRRRSCAETKKLVARNPGLSGPLKRKIYSQAQDQPCP